MTANDYRSAHERCASLAERSPNDETRQAWLNLAETYATLLILEGVDFKCPQIGTKRDE